MTFSGPLASYKRPTDQMRTRAPIRFTFASVACAILACGTVLCAQTRHDRASKHSAEVSAAPTQATLPPLVPTVPVTPPTPPTPAELPAHAAEVGYANGLLTVTASNSSLNQILRDISRETRMKITGGVVDERVFGQYGPAPAAQILNALLDGTGSNMLLMGSNGAAPAELILTPRTGGVTPPNPDAAAMNASEQSDDQADQSPKETVRPGSPANGSPANASSEPAAQPASPAPQPQSPNGVKTPQDIFNELQKMRQQQAAQQRANPQ